ncbi:retrovirus-related pol polyprotein from transposon TNT 1-94 [Tanacetum coccineum]
MSSSSSSIQNMAFVSSSNNNTSSSNEAVNAAHEVTTASTQVNTAYSTNIDNLSDDVLCSFFASQLNSPQLAYKDLQQIHPDDIKEMDLRWQMVMLTMRAKRFLKNTGRKLNVNGNETIEEWLNYALMAYPSSSSDSEDIQIGEITIRELRKKLEKIQKEKDSIQFNVDKFESASKSLDKLIECQIVDNCKKGLGYEKYNVVPPPYTGNFMPPTPDLSFTGLDKFVNNPVVENRKSDEELSKIVKKSDDSPIIEDWVLDMNVARPMSYLSKIAHSTVKRPIHKNTTFKSSNINQRVNTVMGKNVNTAKPKAIVNAVKGNNVNVVRASACWVWKPKTKIQVSDGLGPQKKLIFLPNVHGNPQIDLQDQEVIDSGCSRHMTGNLSYLTDYEETDRGYVAFGGNPKGGKITGKSTIKTVDERRNMTLIEVTRTMLVDSKLPTTFWAEAVNIACYVQNRVLVVKPYSKTPYKRFHGRTPTLSFMIPFGCPVTILNTIDYLGKFDGKANEGFLVGYSLNSKAFRVFKGRTRIVEENLHIRFSESTPNAVGSGPDWLFDIDALTRTINYEPIIAGTQSNGFAGTKASDNAGQARKETLPVKNYIFLPLWTADPSFSQDLKSSQDDGSKPSSYDRKKVDEDPRKDSECNDQEKKNNVNSTNNINAAGTNEVNGVGRKTSIELTFDPNMSALKDYSIFDFSNDDKDDGAEADMNNLDTTIQEEPKKVIHALKDPSWIEAMQEELLQFKLQEVWTLLELVAQGYTQEEGIDYDEVFAPVPRIEAIMLFLAYASFNDFVVYQMDVKSVFSIGRLKKKFYMDDIIFGSTKKELCIAFEKLLHKKFQRSSMGELIFFLGLQVQQKKDGKFISQDKYVVEILKKFGFTEVKTASTPI